MEEPTAHLQKPTAPPVTSAFAPNPAQAPVGNFGATNVQYHKSARDGTALHLQQLVHEQSNLGRQVQDSTARLLGVNQQLADSVVFSQWFGNAAPVDSNEHKDLERTQEAIDAAEAEVKSLKAEVRLLEAQKNDLQRQLHCAAPTTPKSAPSDRSIVIQLQEELSKAKRLVRTKETLVSAMTSEMDSLREQLSEKSHEVERLSEQCQQMSAPWASSFQLPLAARLSYSAGTHPALIGDLTGDQKDGVQDDSDAAAYDNPELSEKDLRAMLKKKTRQLAEVVKINQSWEKQYKRLSRDHEALKAAQEAKSEARDDSRLRSYSKRRSRHHRSDTVLAELQSALETSQHEAAKEKERCSLLEQKLHEKQRSLIDETEQHQLLLAQKESLEAHMKMSGKGEETVRQIQLQLENVRKELQTSMNSELRMRKELSASQAQVDELRQQLAAAAAESAKAKADQVDVSNLQSELGACRDRIAALETQSELNADDFRREQHDKQLVERQLTTMRAQLQRLLQAPAIPLQDNIVPPGQESPSHFSGEHAEIDNQTTAESQAEAARFPSDSLSVKCPECDKQFKQRGDLLDHMLSCPQRDS